jgi:hypothetical protein
VVGRKVNSDGTMPETAVMISYSWGRDDSPHMAYSPVDNAFGTADHFSHSLPAVTMAESVGWFFQCWSMSSKCPMSAESQCSVSTRLT